MMNVLSQQRMFRQKEARKSIYCLIWGTKDTDRRMTNKREMDEREECINLGVRLRIKGYVVYVYKNFQEKMYFSFTIHYQEVIKML